MIQVMSSVLQRALNATLVLLHPELESRLDDVISPALITVVCSSTASTADTAL